MTGQAVRPDRYRAVMMSLLPAAVAGAVGVAVTVFLILLPGFGEWPLGRKVVFVVAGLQFLVAVVEAVSRTVARPASGAGPGGPLITSALVTGALLTVVWHWDAVWAWWQGQMQ